ncbi:gliding motility protein GldM [Proteiniphilum sp. UBA5384]|uniref:type IX secretion system motor protein PorM/GldM n=1 Tax=Proteiniphilum sp. UBA5384 TaxID=1947279 RepID=UPI0025D48E3E|nr:gliding motility protein GldM [Proteiniphilum sp. UBA5384]
MAVNSPNSPRQKMINLMYLVFISMLALNVSVEVLDGFKMVDNSLEDSSGTMLERNKLIMDELTAYHIQNPDKAEEWYRKGMQVRSMSDSLTRYIDELKLRMVREADGKKADINNIKNKDNLEAASVVMLSPVNGEGKNFKNAIGAYRDSVTQLVTDSARRIIIEKNLSTQSSGDKSWEASLFEQMPLAAAITMLTKIENDIRSSEGEALTNILHNVDVGDFRVNRLNAYIIPESDIVIQGSSYNARIILSAEDSTCQPHIVVNGQHLDARENGYFSVPTNHTGTFPVDGYLEMAGSDGTITRHQFTGNYTVVEPAATIAPTLMNVLYAGIDNEIGISVPGISLQDISATMTGGTLTRRGNMWIARPATVGKNVTISVSASTTGGNIRHVATKEFRVRALPDPTPYIEDHDANGNPGMFKGGGFQKAALMKAVEVKAAIDDGILSIPFRVVSFRTVFFDSMGNAIPEVSDGNHFSERQKEQIRRLPRGSYFYISGVRAAGPDGTEREIAVMEIRVM